MKKSALVLAVLLLVMSVPVMSFGADVDTELVDLAKTKIETYFGELDFEDMLVVKTALYDANDSNAALDAAYLTLDLSTGVGKRLIDLGFKKDHVGTVRTCVLDERENIDKTSLGDYLLVEVPADASLANMAANVANIRSSVETDAAEMVNALEGQMKAGYENKKAEFAVNLIEKVYNNASINEQSDGSWNVAYGADFNAAVNTVIETYTVQDALSVTEIAELKVFVEAYIDGVKGMLSDETGVESLLLSLNKFNAYSSGGTSGGGSAPAVETDPEPVVEPPTTETSPTGETTVTTKIENAAVVTTSEDGAEEAAIDDEAVTEAIEGLEAETEGTESVPTIELDIPAKGTNVSVGIELETMDELAEKEVNLTIKTDNIKYKVPAKVMQTASKLVVDLLENQEESSGLNAEDLDIELNSKEIEKEELLSKVGEDTAEGKAIAEAIKGKTKLIEISIDIVNDGNKVGEVHELGDTMTIDISLKGMDDVDGDKLGVYYVDEDGNYEFMSGEIVVVDGQRMIRLKTNHLSKFAILEVNITYPDVSDHWSKKYVESMGAKHVINGYTDGTFLPEKAVTRVEFAKMLVEAMGYDDVAYDGAFPDVSNGDWYAGYVATAEANGIVLGYPDGTFKPNQKITRLVMAAMLTRAYDMQLEGEASDSLSQFSDKGEIAEWGTEAAAKAVKAEFMNGMDGAFNPEGTATRAQAATAIYRLYNK